LPLSKAFDNRKDRYTVLPETVLRELENYWRLCRPPRPWLFPSSRHPDQPMSDGTAQKIFYAAVARAGLPDKGGIHCLRHSFATHWLEAGLPLFILKRMLGHNSLSTTCKYVHPSREYLAKVKSPLDTLNPLIQQNQQALYNLLFAAASETILTFGRNNLRAQLGVTAVLHTWSQTLIDHYHLHCIVTGGGPALDGNRWIHSRPDYLFHVGSLSQVFRGKFCEGLEALYQDGELQFHGQIEPLGSSPAFGKLLREVRAKGWVVYSKRPFAGPQQVLAYLSRYTHRVGISNRRLIKLDPQSATVSFD
jgi:hypothetical protein